MARAWAASPPRARLAYMHASSCGLACAGCLQCTCKRFVQAAGTSSGWHVKAVAGYKCRPERVDGNAGTEPLRAALQAACRWSSAALRSWCCRWRSSAAASWPASSC